MNIEPARLFHLLSDETRLRCLLLMAREGELCVCELTHATGVAQPKVSRHLALLREAGLVRDRREGLWIHYCLHPELPAWVRDVLKATLAGVRDAPPYADDLTALAAMPDRPGAPRCA